MVELNAPLLPLRLEAEDWETGAVREEDKLTPGGSSRAEPDCICEERPAIDAPLEPDSDWDRELDCALICAFSSTEGISADGMACAPATTASIGCLLNSTMGSTRI